MDKIKKAINETLGIQQAENKTTPEEWIWVEGYKGTKSDMTCQGYQYELGKQHDIDPGTKVEECRNGFHLCLKLEDVLGYYGPRDGNRYFKVKALVRKSDCDNYGKYTSPMCFSTTDKLVSKYIIFTEEVSTEELYATIRKRLDRPFDKMPDLYIKIALETSFEEAVDAYARYALVEDGYSEAFSNFLIDNMKDKFNIAHSLASLEDLSMDVKVMCIMLNNNSEIQQKSRRR